MFSTGSSLYFVLKNNKKRTIEKSAKEQKNHALVTKA